MSKHGGLSTSLPINKTKGINETSEDRKPKEGRRHQCWGEALEGFKEEMVLGPDFRSKRDFSKQGGREGTYSRKEWARQRPGGRSSVRSSESWWRCVGGRGCSAGCSSLAGLRCLGICTGDHCCAHILCQTQTSDSGPLLQPAAQGRECAPGFFGGPSIQDCPGPLGEEP